MHSRQEPSPPDSFGEKNPSCWGSSTRLQEQLADVDHQLVAGAQLIHLALELLQDPHRLYEQATDPARREINQAFFESITVYSFSIETTLNEPFDDFVHAATRYQRVTTGATAATTALTNERRPSQAGASERSLADLLTGVSLAAGSNRAALVELLRAYSNLDLAVDLASLARMLH
ncbi:MAG: hypothetical protein ACJ74O_02645 [Frankiaceae bacterium]